VTVFAALLLVCGIALIWCAVIVIRGPVYRHLLTGLVGSLLALAGLWIEPRTRGAPPEPTTRRRRLRKVPRLIRVSLPRVVFAASLLALVISLGRVAVLSGRPDPPGQPLSGPGGAVYEHAAVRVTRVGRGAEKAWIFEPAEPAVETAPVILFLHGWSLWGPNAYRRWIEHLARRGNIVIYPKYQASLLSLPTRMTANAATGVRHALTRLGEVDHITPDLDRVAAVGHSLGGVIAVNLTANAVELDVPQARALMCVQPGDPSHARFGRTLAKVDLQFKMILSDCSTIPPGTLVLVVVSDRDRVVQDVTGRIIWDGIRHLPAAERDYVTVVSDYHGYPRLKAVHLMAAAPARHSIVDWTKAGTDALDYCGTWKLFDGLTDAAFYGRNRQYALGNTPEQRHMGKWSDGTPVKELEVMEK